MPKNKIASCALFLFSFCSYATAYAAEGESSEHGDESKNEIAVFLGATHEGRRDNSGAVGLEYERRLNETLGIGVLAEFTAGDSGFWVYAIPVTFHSDRWKFVVAPGVEYADGQTEQLLRLGAGYELESGDVKITPSLNLDFVGGDVVLVVGVTFGIGF